MHLHHRGCLGQKVDLLGALHAASSRLLQFAVHISCLCYSRCPSACPSLQLNAARHKSEFDSCGRGLKVSFGNDVRASASTLRTGAQTPAGP
jgi:hypothetical protein